MRRLASLCFFVVVLVPTVFVGAQVPSTAKRVKIDAHFHFEGTPQAIKQIVETYRRNNTMVCAFTPYTALDLMKQAVVDYPDVFIPFGSIQIDDFAQALSQIDAYHAAGFRGIGEIYSPLDDYDNPRYNLIYERMASYGMVANFHLGIVSRERPEVPEFSSMARMKPSMLDAIARRFPRLTIVGAHFGNPWYEEAAEAGRWNPNLLFDITGSSLIKKADHPEFWGQVLWWRSNLSTMHSPGGQDAFEKVVFGTDEGPEGLEPNIERFQRFLDGNNVPEAVREKCWYGTMAKLLNITPRARS